MPFIHESLFMRVFGFKELYPLYITAALKNEICGLSQLWNRTSVKGRKCLSSSWNDSTVNVEKVRCIPRHQMYNRLLDWGCFFAGMSTISSSFFVARTSLASHLTQYSFQALSRYASACSLLSWISLSTRSERKHEWSWVSHEFSWGGHEHVLLL